MQTNSTTAGLFELLGLGDELDPAANELLDAAVEQFCITGVRRTTTDEIARAAGVNRATLYRHLGPRKKIISAAYRRESHRALGRLVAALNTPEPSTAREKIRAIIIAAMSELHGNALLHRLQRADADETRKALTTDAAEVVELGTLTLRLLIDDIRASHLAPDEEPDFDAATVAAMLTRMTQSIVVSPGGPLSLATEEEQIAFADEIATPLIMNATAPKRP
ncbi:TetR/AcrR family transcriptional regulator [Corynebacterium hansenii]|uniref:TetR/AcrR family transcriptional regulator n=1 Tax=Corynebacterium hansenii TaxID=394964 RepID=A0ABV7ZMT2_9CORY|nr:TetR/AcrR family transcriptional regulator [Corynebacterium hansenii]WJZ00436.1 HTH-type transcriptional repressor KstR2 [Corynebacterium hansenii]